MSVAPYVAPSVTAAGLVVPAYQSIMADNLQAYLNIYGANQYVASDSGIYQLLSILSLKQSDTCLAAQLAYNQSSPQTAVGAGLDRVVKMNGLVRAPFSYSTVSLTCVGSSGSVLTNCFAQDQAGNLWALPSPVTITGGSISVQAVCTTPGAVAAEAGTVTIIATPTNGWTSVTNPADAITGLPVETDSELRARQAVSVALPSVTPVASTVAAVLAVSGVTRMAPGYPTPGGPGSSIENPTGSTDSWSNPAHSISIVAEGGLDLDVATAIYIKKTIGCLTNGTTAVVVTDANTGYQETISFFRPSYTPKYFTDTIHGYTVTPTTTVVTAVQTALVNYLNTLAIGETVSAAALNYEAMAINAKLSAPAFGVQSLKLGTTATPTGTADVTMPTYHNVAQGITANVLVSTV